jgi:hypothetical protein
MQSLPMTYEVVEGGLQPYIRRYGDSSTPMFLRHFGRAQYSRKRSVLSASLRKQGQEICDLLNTGQIDEATAVERLKVIHY